MLTVTDHLSEEDRAKYLEIEARRWAVEINPRAFDAEETDQRLRDWLSFCAYVARRYAIDEYENWKVSATDGSIYYGVED